MYQDLAAAIDAVARELARSIPPPRATPYFLLDGAGAYDLRVLDRFLDRGIFRKYEFALDIGCGLGGRARWLAARSGCRVLGVDPRPAVVAAAAALNRRARMDGQVLFQAGQLTSLPLRERVFTHVWMVDAVLHSGSAAALAEAFRVLRRGAHFALQCLDDTQAAALRELMCEAGFVDTELSEVALVERPHADHVAQARLRQALHAQPRVTAAWEQFTPLSGARAVQIYGRRPA